MPGSPSLREVRIFIAVYEEQSFTGAAVREHATQSGVSQHINNLEGRLGVALFQRGKGQGVRPTPAGEAYYLRCIEILKAFGKAAQSLEPFSTGLTGEVRVGLMPTMTRCQLPAALLTFTSSHPNVAVSVVEAYSHSLTEQVRSGALNFAIVPRTARSMSGLRESLFLRTRECLVSARDAAGGVRHRKAVPAARLEGARLVVPGPSNARREAIERYIAASGVHIERRLELDAMLGTLGLVAGSDWQAILPELLMADEMRQDAKGEGAWRRFDVNPLADPPLTLDLVLIEPLREPLSAPAQALLAILREVALRVAGAFGSDEGDDAIHHRN